MIISVVRTVILYFLIILAMRLMGKRQLGELQPTELVVTLMISDLASVPMQDNGLPLLHGVLPIAVLVALEILLSGLMMKSPFIAQLISGTPQPIIVEGKIREKTMRKLRITVDDLAESLRQQQIFDWRKVQYAIAETGGRISVYCYPPNQPENDGMPVVIVSDGEVSDWGLSLSGHDRDWLKNKLTELGKKAEEVFLLTADKYGDTYLVTMEEVGKESKEAKKP